MARLRGAPPSPALRRAHDRHRPWIVLPVFAALLVYAWCYTHLAQWTGLPTPRELVDALGLVLPRVVDADGNLDAKLLVPHTARFGNDDERLIVFVALFACFVSTYFAPLRHKSLALVAWFFPAFAALYGLQATATLLAAHLAIYLGFHPQNPHSARIAGLLGALLIYLVPAPLDPAPRLFAALGAAALAGLLYRRAAATLAAGGRLVAALQTALIQACMITTVACAAREGLTGETWRLPVGLVFFFYQWARLMVYQADVRDGEVPRALGLVRYLAVFLSPVVIPNLAHAPYLGQGYSYLEERHLVADKTALVLSGLRLWGLALLYMVFAEQLVVWFVAGVERCASVRVYRFTSELVRAHLAGERPGAATVLLSTLVDQARIFLIYGGVTHFRVGAWRVMGYRVETQYDRPWLATNLANLWGRFAFHFREFLVRVFYYPVFLAVCRRRRMLRVFVATMIATVVGNLVWGHLPPAAIPRMRWQTVTTLLSTWPYFVLLGLGIALTQLWLLRRPRTRTPWTRDRWFVLDLVCAYLTLQYFALIHIYIRPQPGSTLASSTRLLLRGLGVDLER